MRKLTLAAFVVLIWAGALIAGEPAPQVIHGKTVAVVHFDLESMTPQSIEAAFGAVFGQVEGDMAAMRDAALARHGRLRELGATGLTLAVLSDDGDAVPMVGVTHGPDADAGKIAAWIEANDLVPDAQTSLEEGVVIGSPAGRRPAGGGSAEAAGRFADAMRSAGGGPMAVAFLPSESVRRQVREAAMDARGEQRIVAMFGVEAVKADMIAAAMRLGEQPNATILARMPDASSARQLSTLWVGTLRIMQQMLMAAASRQDEDPPDLDPVIASLTPDQDGSQLLVQMDTPAAKQAIGTMLPSILAARRAAQRVVLMSNMRQVTVAIMVYEADHGQLPPHLDALVEADVIKGDGLKKMLVHPAKGHSPAFIYVRPADTAINIERPSATPMLIEVNAAGEPVAGGYTGYADGHVAQGAVE